MIRSGLESVPRQQIEGAGGAEFQLACSRCSCVIAAASLEGDPAAGRRLHGDVHQGHLARLAAGRGGADFCGQDRSSTAASRRSLGFGAVLVAYFILSYPLEPLRARTWRNALHHLEIHGLSDRLRAHQVLNGRDPVRRQGRGRQPDRAFGLRQEHAVARPDRPDSADRRRRLRGRAPGRLFSRASLRASCAIACRSCFSSTTCSRT